MTTNTAIEWADHTFNPWIGCTKVGPGCDHCYAEQRMDKRLHTVNWGPGQPRKRTSATNWRDPIKWEKNAQQFLDQHGRRQRVFCASLADVFDNEVPAEWRRDLFELIRRCENLDFLLLTKRVGNITRMLQEVASTLRSEHGAQAEREPGLQAGPVWRAGDRRGGANLARGQANLRPLDVRNEGDALPPGPGGEQDAGRLPAGASDDRREAALRGRGALGVAALQGVDSAGPYGEPQGRNEGPESPGQPGVGDVQRAAPACGTGPGCRACRREGLETPQGAGDGGGSHVDASIARAGLAGEGHRGALRDHAEVGVAHLHREDLAARWGLLAWVESWLAGDPPTNVWLGATIVNQEEADRDILKLLAVPARVRFLSMEPLLGPVDLNHLGKGFITHNALRRIQGKYSVAGQEVGSGGSPIDWVIVGGESGPNARPVHPDWARSLRDQCVAAGVPFLFKQWGEWAPVAFGDMPSGKSFPCWPHHGPGAGQCILIGKKAAGRQLDGRTWDEVPS